MAQSKTSRYSEAGVDIDKGNELVTRIKTIVAPHFGRGVLTDIGGFNWTCQLKKRDRLSHGIETSSGGQGPTLPDGPCGPVIDP